MSDAARQSRLAVAEDLVGLPEHPRAEIIRGAIEYKASPSFEHGSVQFIFGKWLADPYQRGHGGPGGWWFGTEVEIELETHEIYLPDVAGWRRERPRGRPIRVRPDWVCEILSPSTARRDIGPKLVTYHRAGVGHYWVVDPQNETMMVYRATADGFVVHATAGRADRGRFPPFDDIEIFVGELPPPLGLFFDLEALHVDLGALHVDLDALHVDLDALNVDLDAKHRPGRRRHRRPHRRR